MNKLHLPRLSFSEFFSSLAALLLINSLVVLPSHAVGAVTISAVPSASTVSVGSSFSVTIQEDSLTNEVNAVEADLTYPAGLLQVVSIDASTSAFDVDALKTSGGGSITIARGKLPPALTGSQTVAKVNFKAIAAGAATIAFAPSTVLVNFVDNSNVLDTAVSGNVTVLSSGAPSGSFDIAQQLPGAVRVAGWALDPSVNGPINVHVYIDGAWAGAVPASRSRGDVGAHGFDSSVPWTKAGTHQVCLWAVGDAFGPPNMGLGCRSLQVNDDPDGSLDLVQQYPGAIHVAGWGLDRSLDGPAKVHVYVDGTLAGVLNASLSRADIGSLFPGYGPNHGFVGTLPYAKAGSHQVCAWVIGDNLGAPNFGLGCRSLTVNNDPWGHLDIIKKATGGFRAAGWAVDRSLAGPAKVHFYVDSHLAGVLNAAGLRPDLAPYFPGYGTNHGFDGVITAASGTHAVCAWVVGDSLGSPNIGIGCWTITL